MPSCSVPDCNITWKFKPEGYTFHRFPKYPILREKWLRVINKPNWTPTQGSQVCSKHFPECCFVKRARRRLLIKGSVPTISVPVSLPIERKAGEYVDILPEPELSQQLQSQSQILSKQIVRNEKLAKRYNIVKGRNVQKRKNLKSLNARTKRMAVKLGTLRGMLDEFTKIPAVQDHINNNNILRSNKFLKTLINRVKVEDTSQVTQYSQCRVYSTAFVTVPSTGVGKTLASALVQNKLAASVNMIPQVTSIYDWNGEINEDTEVLLMIKTRTSRMEELTEFVRSNHPYDVCDIISLPIQNGNPSYLNWLGERVPKKEMANDSSVSQAFVHSKD